jgi:hypothetical protein
MNPARKMAVTRSHLPLMLRRVWSETAGGRTGRRRDDRAFKSVSPESDDRIKTVKISGHMELIPYGQRN